MSSGSHVKVDHWSILRLELSYKIDDFCKSYKYSTQSSEPYHEINSALHVILNSISKRELSQSAQGRASHTYGTSMWFYRDAGPQPAYSGLDQHLVLSSSNPFEMDHYIPQPRFGTMSEMSRSEEKLTLPLARRFCLDAVVEMSGNEFWARRVDPSRL